jgi:hypothetical protein
LPEYTTGRFRSVSSLSAQERHHWHQQQKAAMAKAAILQLQGTALVEHQQLEQQQQGLPHQRTHSGGSTTSCGFLIYF